MTSYGEGYHLFDVRISIVNRSNSYIDIVLFVLPALKENQVIKGIKYTI